MSPTGLPEGHREAETESPCQMGCVGHYEAVGTLGIEGCETQILLSTTISPPRAHGSTVHRYLCTRTSLVSPTRARAPRYGNFSVLKLKSLPPARVWAPQRWRVRIWRIIILASPCRRSPST